MPPTKPLPKLPPNRRNAPESLADAISRHQRPPLLLELQLDQLCPGRSVSLKILTVAGATGGIVGSRFRQQPN
jgi:hypothetical protein